MSESSGGDDPATGAGRPEESRESAAERRRRLDRVFGTVLPDTTADERDERDTQRGGSSRDDELRRDVPPHHGA